jgi:transposase
VSLSYVLSRTDQRRFSGLLWNEYHISGESTLSSECSVKHSEEFAQHNGTVILPARPGKPKDKAKIEVGVQVAERWILARLRHETFFSLPALNARITELRTDLNARRMRRYEASRQELFARLDRPALRPLPATPFVYGEWKVAKVGIDSHVEVDHHYYSVPHALVQTAVDVRLTALTVEIFQRGQRVAAHLRSAARGRHTTVTAHMPLAHQRHRDWSPARLIAWAATVGPQTAAFVEALLTDRPHPEQGYRSCLGILRLAKRDGAVRLEAACARALAAGARSVPARRCDLEARPRPLSAAGRGPGLPRPPGGP